MRNTDSSWVEGEQVKTVGARWKYADSILGLDGRGGSGSTSGTAGRCVLAGTRAKDTTKHSTSNHEDSDGDTKFDPVAGLLLGWLMWSDVTGGRVVVRVTRAVWNVSVD